MRSLLLLPRRVVAYFHYMLAASYRHFGNLYGLRQEYDRAVRAFTRAIAWDAEFARAYMERGILFWRELDAPQQAIDDLTAAYELDPSLVEARFNRGIAYQQLRDYGAALSDFRAYLSQGTHPHWREYAANMVRELEGWKRPEDTPPGVRDSAG